MIRQVTYLGAGMLALTACTEGAEVGRAAVRAPSEAVAFAPKYLGIGTRLLDGDLVAFDVKMTGARDNHDVAAYAECAAAQYALIRGYGFARHVRTAVDKRGEVWEGDATYVISDALPDGLAKIDAEVAVSACKENGIPTI